MVFVFFVVAQILMCIAPFGFAGYYIGVSSHAEAINITSNIAWNNLSVPSILSANFTTGGVVAYVYNCGSSYGHYVTDYIAIPETIPVTDKSYN
ncbi:TPA: hypothetical protein JZG45_004859 [Escherichia coli]|nr:hypothetical protein [Escherichia coli]